MEPTDRRFINPANTDVHADDSPIVPRPRVDPLPRSSLSSASSDQEGHCLSALGAVWSVASHIGSFLWSVVEWLWNCCTCADEPQNSATWEQIAQMQAEQARRTEEERQRIQMRSQQHDQEMQKKLAAQQQQQEERRLKHQAEMDRLRQQTEESNRRLQEQRAARQQARLASLQQPSHVPSNASIPSEPLAPVAPVVQKQPESQPLPPAAPFLPLSAAQVLQGQLDVAGSRFRQQMEQILQKREQAEKAAEPQEVVRRALINGSGDIPALLGDDFFQGVFDAQDTAVVLSCLWIDGDESSKKSIVATVSAQTFAEYREQVLQRFTEIMGQLPGSPAKIDLETYVFYKQSASDINTKDLYHRHRYFINRRPVNGALPSDEGDWVDGDIDAEWLTGNYLNNNFSLITPLTKKLEEAFPGKHPLAG